MPEPSDRQWRQTELTENQKRLLNEKGDAIASIQRWEKGGRVRVTIKKHRRGGRR